MWKTIADRAWSRQVATGGSLHSLSNPSDYRKGRRLKTNGHVFSFLFTLFFTSSAFAQISDFNDKLVTGRFYVESPSYEVDIKSQSNSASEIIWKPNIRALNGVDFAIKDFLTLGIAWATQVDSGQETQFGNSNYNDYRLGINFNGFHADANYQRYTGLYVENTTSVNPAATNDVKIQDHNFTATNISLNSTFILNPKTFSIIAALGQSDRQESSGGSLLLGLALSQTSFQSPTGLIPSLVRASYGSDQNIQNVQFYSANFKIGYGYSFIWSQYWFLTVLLDFGGGPAFRSYTDGVTTTSSASGTHKADALFSFGYNGNSFLAAVIATADNTEYSTSSLDIPSIIGDIKIAIGAHF